MNTDKLIPGEYYFAKEKNGKKWEIALYYGETSAGYKVYRTR